MDLKLAKKELKQAISFDFRTLVLIQKYIDCGKYRKFYNFIKKYDYRNKNICETSVRKECYLLVNSVVPHPVFDLEKTIYKEVLYQSLCAELYFVIISIEKADLEYESQHLTLLDKLNILKNSWHIIKKLYDSYYKEYERYEGKYEYDIRTMPEMPRVFNKYIIEIKKYLESRKEIDTRDFGQKVFDSTLSTFGYIIAFALKIICLFIIIILMAKCCGAVVHPFG